MRQRIAFFTSSYFAYKVGLTLIVVLHVKTVKTRYPGALHNIITVGMKDDKSLKAKGIVCKFRHIKEA